MKIIEFAGLPGCGKSTICKGVIEKLRENHKVYTYQEIVRMVSTSKRKKLFERLIRMSASYRRYRRLLDDYIKPYDEVSANAIYVLMALYGMPLIFRYLTPKHIVVLDEGFVQTLTSIPHLQPIKDDETLKKLTTFLNEQYHIHVVCCFADEVLTIQRLRARNRGDRFNSIKDDEALRQALFQKQRNLDTVSEHFCVLGRIVSEDSKESLGKNIDAAYQIICGIL